MNNQREKYESWVNERYMRPDLVKQHGYAWEAWQAALASQAQQKINLDSDNWAATFHAAFRHAGVSKAAKEVHENIYGMEDGEWIGIVDYMLDGIRKALSLPPSPEENK